MTQILAPRLLPWAKRVWTAILENHGFRLKAPQINRRLIAEALSADRPPLALLAGIALAATPATNVDIAGVRGALVDVRDADR